MSPRKDETPEEKKLREELQKEAVRATGRMKGGKDRIDKATGKGKDGKGKGK